MPADRCLHCTRPAKANGLCSAHLHRLYRYGDPLCDGDGWFTCPARGCTRQVRLGHSHDCRAAKVKA